jgi:UDP-glucose:(heptosyl)LPS alpha-1,3-glucosyltransferase
MRIALCHDYIDPSRGGCETYIVDLANRLASDGHEVTLIARRVERGRLHPAVLTHLVDFPAYPRFLKPYRYTRVLQSHLSRFRYDVSVGFDKCWGVDILFPQGGLHSASARANLCKDRSPTLRLLRAFAQLLDPAKRAYARIEQIQYVLVPPRRIIVNSQMTANHFRQQLRIAPAQISVIHSAISPQRFNLAIKQDSRQEWRRRLSIADAVPLGLFLATNYRLKGLEPLIHSLTYLPTDQPFQLLVAGNNRFAPYLRLARRLGVDHRLHFIGHCADTQHLYFAADLLIHPTFYDPCSLVALEAIYCGLPVITTRMNGAAELLNPQCSMVIDDPHDHPSLARAIVELVAAPARLNAAKYAARLAASAWTFNHHYQRILAVFTEVAQSKQMLYHRAG